MVIEVSAGVLVGPDGRVLLVRKKHTLAFMNPGGKPEQGESPAATLCRELSEELNVTTSEAELESLGGVCTDAANEPGERLIAHCFRLELASPEHRIGAEVAESLWVDPSLRVDAVLAPLAKLLLRSSVPSAWP